MMPTKRLAHACTSVAVGQIAGILLGSTLHLLTYRQYQFTEAFRLFGPIPGRLIEIVYSFAGAMLLWRFSRRARNLVASPIAKVGCRPLL